MSFLDSNNAEYLSARITQEGRRAIAKGDFNITYFVVGDSEFDYSIPFDNLNSVTGSINYQSTFAPLDKDTYVKYPIKYNNSGTIYGSPVSFNQTTILRNSIGPAGFVSEYKNFDAGSLTGTTIASIDVSGNTIYYTNTFNVRGITGGKTLVVNKPSGMTYQNCEYITLTLNSLTGATSDKNVIGAKINSFVYKIISVSGGVNDSSQTIEVDRELPNFNTTLGAGISGNVICNKCEVEYNTTDVDNTCRPVPPSNTSQHNPWTLNVVYGKKPIGLSETNPSLRSLSGYTSNKHIGTKEFLGYNSTGQTFIDYTGGTLSKPTSYVDSYNVEIEITPDKQRAVAIVHFSEVGDIVNDEDRFFRYDDYISTNSSTLPENNLSDEEYFQVYIPFLLYHRNTGSTLGAVFHMATGATSDKYVVSKISNSSVLKYRDLLDENNIKVGKVFINKKIIVFDDPEIVTCLDYKSNRKYTLPAPKVISIPSTGTTSLLSSDTVKLYLTYYTELSTRPLLNSLPCGYITEVTGLTNGSNVSFSFNGGFDNMVTTKGSFYKGFAADKFYVLAQTGTTVSSLVNSNWKKIDFTNELQVAGGDNIIVPSSITGVSFTLDYNKFNSGTPFDLTSHFSTQDMVFTGNTGPHFGDEQPFPGSVRVVRASDIEEMNFMINLPPNTFSTSQNPTYVSGNPRITEVALLDSNKKTMVMAKTSKPLERTTTQVFSVKLDF